MGIAKLRGLNDSFSHTHNLSSYSSEVSDNREVTKANLNPSKAPSKGELTSKDISLKKFYLLGAKSCYNGKRCKGLKKKKEFLVMANKGKWWCP